MLSRHVLYGLSSLSWALRVLLFYILKLHFYVCLCVVAHKGQEKALDPLELKLQDISQTIYKRTGSVLNCRVIFLRQPPQPIISKDF